MSLTRRIALPWVDLDGFGPSQSNDWTDAYAAAIARAVARGGAQVVAGPATLDLDGAVAVPSGVNLAGASGNTTGTAGTRIRATSADAVVRFGVQGSGSWGGRTRDLCLDGNSLSPTMLSLGRTLERTFQNLSVVNCAAGGAAVLIEEAQNNQFVGLVVNNNGGDGIRFDRGAAGNRFYGVETSANGGGGGYHVRFTATAATVTNLAAYPLNNQFFGGIFERDGGLLDAIVYHGAGADNVFWGVNLSSSGAAREFPQVRMEVGDALITTQSTRLTFYGGMFTGNIATSTWLDLDDGSIVRVIGFPLIQGFLNQLHLRDTLSRVKLLGDPVLSNITNTLSGTSVGAATQMSTTFDAVTVTNASALHQTAINGDGNTQFWVEKANGTDVVAVNTNTPGLLLPNGTDLIVYSGNYSGQVASIDGATGSIRTSGSLGVGNSAAATTPGTVAKKIQVFDASGASLGFLAVYDAIT